MEDITTCERCGRVIPVLDSGCPYCETDPPGLHERPYLPLALRLLLVLFCVDAAASIVLATLTLLANTAPDRGSTLVVFLSLFRVMIAGVTILAVVFSQPWGRWVPLVFIGYEAITGFVVALGVLPHGVWAGGMLPPLWTVLFLFLFLREDVQSRFDPRIVDRREVRELLRVVEGSRHRERR